MCEVKMVYITLHIRKENKTLSTHIKHFAIMSQM